MLSKLYEQAGNVPEAFTHFKQHVTFKDSIRNLAVVREMADQRTNFEIARKQTEVDLLNEQKANQRNIVIAIGVALFLIMLLALGLYRRNKYIGRTKRIIENEKNRSDRLLLNILPQETALELKEKGKVEAKRFEAVTVLFTDFKNFTHYAENLPPEELVKSVDFYFSKFDEIVDRHGLEKIKTVGDAYMCASGVPFPVEDHAYRVIAAACDMINFVESARRVEDGKETRFEVRIGINSGPVVAGVVGNKKWAYDIWGDAVNIAARMETCSEIGKINISENTYNLVKGSYDCDFRGEIEVKNKGMMKMYFVKGASEAKQSNVA
jgi:class 3 adenylate cyclase